MESRKIVFGQTGIIAVGELILSALMVGVFAAVGAFELNVLWGALVGSLVMTANYFLMAVTVSVAANRAEQGNPKEGQGMIQLSGTLRLIGMGVALFAAIKLGCNVVATVLPLAFVRPILMVSEFFGKKGD